MRVQTQYNDAQQWSIAPTIGPSGVLLYRSGVEFTLT